MWHEKTRPLVAADNLAVIGIVQEQHPRRGALFMQWKQMDWPILVDPFNLLKVAAVPITVLIDEHGIVRKVAARPADLDAFMAASYLSDSTATATTAELDPHDLASLAFADAANLNRAIVQLNRPDARRQFQRGVAMRLRYDSKARQPGDFAEAVSAWEESLRQNPNQYIWRRRLQQYGPRLDKPYPFYDWVAQAQKEIAARGETPVALETDLSGAEIAQPADRIAQATTVPHPDPAGQVQRDDHRVRVDSVVVHATDRESNAARVHLDLHLVSVEAAKTNPTQWNDEGGPITFAANGDQSIRVGPIKLTSGADSAIRRLEFEVTAENDESLPDELRGALFYHLCIGNEQQCVYLRQDLTVRLGRGR